MQLSKLKELIQKEFGKKIEYSYQCDALSQAIQDSTSEAISITTLKRLFGFAQNPHLARKSTLDILARYVGYSDYEKFIKDFSIDSEISDFEPIESISVQDLESGDEIRVTYEPNRSLRLKYMHDDTFKVLDSKSSKIQAGDTFIFKIIKILDKWGNLVSISPYKFVHII